MDDDSTTQIKHHFEVSADAADFTALGLTVQEMGAVMVETSLLTNAILEDGQITAAELDAAQIANSKTAFTETVENGIYYVLKENITDVSVSYSVSAYVTVRYADGTVKTLVNRYDAEDHARSVKAVSELAYADRVNVRGTSDGKTYAFKASKDYAVGDYTTFSYSPYTKEQLDLLAEFKK